MRRGVAPIERASAVRKPADDATATEGMAAVASVSAGDQAPVDVDRVAEIRKAIEQGTYPLIPTEIADGIIAAGLYQSAGE
ncbi:flagellar biosynthesis anti-sigma factor FlgM [Alteriqipengyuania lutimaris]|uniref:Flagellar biosynthesis anti-sigma factor FlgM n=1 Tax=Alteriqipengyuania lutimaris TaxID=1538146 RepID=A0A395LK36_9SPHN|nr:flagellar biosynthesis anti-sigma factor FlgM [Alteriqipengyuania lutimaris]